MRIQFNFRSTLVPRKFGRLDAHEASVVHAAGVFSCAEQDTLKSRDVPRPVSRSVDPRTKMNLVKQRLGLKVPRVASMGLTTSLKKARLESDFLDIGRVFPGNGGVLDPSCTIRPGQNVTHANKSCRFPGSEDRPCRSLQTT